jgi:hypothetical protein
MRRFVLLLGVLAAVGCGSSAPTGGSPKAITWDEYRKLPAEDRDDPYVLNHLDDDARKRLAEAERKRKK